jgi:hypothetical protein
VDEIAPGNVPVHAELAVVLLHRRSIGSPIGVCHAVPGAGAGRAVRLALVQKRDNLMLIINEIYH